MLRKLMEQQKESIDYFFERVEMEELHRAFELLLACKGAILCSGVGKSGLVAQKIAATFVSTGTRALFLCPTHALHGDLGLLTSDDVLIALSKSGESQELLDLLLPTKRKGAKILAVVSSRGSQLERGAFVSVHLPIYRELCPFNLAPTISTEVQMILGDLLAIALMQTKQFSIADFADNHPAGLLGKKITLRVADVMLQGNELPCCTKRDRLIDQLHELSIKRCGCLLVIDEANALQGIFTDGDLRRAIQTKGTGALECTLGELMIPSPKSIAPERLAIDAIHVMEENPAQLVTVLPVLQGTRLLGLIRMHDIIQAGLHGRGKPFEK